MSNDLNGAICQAKLQHLGSLALDVVEALLTDTETPIETRLGTAFRIVEMCAMGSNKDLEKIIIGSIEKNAQNIQGNSTRLGSLEELLKAGSINIKPECIIQPSNTINEKNYEFVH
ncbi:MAG: hypothetical protein KAI83_06465 [Thiomargarita sp.]|nr:hypothetical protein [Thiomargarita sp.]